MITDIMNKNLSAVRPSGIRRFTAIARSIPDCKLLTIGEPDFNTPKPIKDACVQSLNENLTHYPPNAGDPALRQRISQFEKNYGLDYSEDEIIVTHGATEALFVALHGILNPGDEVIIPTPAFSLYESITQLAGGVPINMDTTDTAFQIDSKKLKSLIGRKTKALVLNSPNNPTGVVYTQETLDAIYNVVKDKDIFIICDDVYCQLAYSHCPRFALFYDLKEKLLVVQSFSKPYAMTGWRMGYLMGCKDVIDRLAVYHGNVVVSVSSISQLSCIAALDYDPSEMVNIYRSRRDYIYKRLSDMNIETVKPEGAFYIFPSFAKFGMNTEEFCLKLAREGKVAGVPGNYFAAEGFVRFSYCYSFEDIAAGMDRLESFLQTLQ